MQAMDEKNDQRRNGKRGCKGVTTNRSLERGLDGGGRMPLLSGQ
jgi:hypothetical protein